MDINIFDYLTEDQKINIAARVFEEQLEKNFMTLLTLRYDSGSGSDRVHLGQIVDTIIHKLVERYIEQLDGQFGDKIQQYIDIEIAREKPIDEHSHTVWEAVNWKLLGIADEIITDRKEEIKPILYSRIMSESVEKALNDFYAEIIRKLDIDKVVSEILSEKQISGSKKLVNCRVCNGRGHDGKYDAAGSRDYTTCPRCRGTGKEIRQ